jgi:sugar phosphate isomerase/epimerase
MMATLDEDYSTLQSIRETGGFRSDVNWNRNLAAARDNARLARSLGISLVTFHAGFIPEQAGDPVRLIMVERLQRIIDEFASCHVNVAFETGQETVQTLLSVLKELERPDVGVNFDPANIILYDKGDPVEALQALNTRVTQVHIKDARHTTVPGTWGTEVPAGTGAVNWKELFACAQRCNLNCDFIIERESGDDRIGDIIRARRLVGRFESDS